MWGVFYGGLDGCCVTLGESFNLSTSQLPHLLNMNFGAGDGWHQGSLDAAVACSLLSVPRRKGGREIGQENLPVLPCKLHICHLLHTGGSLPVTSWSPAQNPCLLKPWPYWRKVYDPLVHVSLSYKTGTNVSHSIEHGWQTKEGTLPMFDILSLWTFWSPHRIRGPVLAMFGDHSQKRHLWSSLYNLEAGLQFSLSGSSYCLDNFWKVPLLLESEEQPSRREHFNEREKFLLSFGPSNF